MLPSIQGLRNYIDLLIPTVKLPADLAMPTSSSSTERTTTAFAVAVTSTSASISPGQLVQLNSNANVQLVENVEKDVFFSVIISFTKKNVFWLY